MSVIPDTKIVGTTIATREIVTIMAKNKTAGHIVNMNSLMGHQVMDVPGLDGVYTATKFAITALTETLRNELNKESLPIKTTVSL